METLYPYYVINVNIYQGEKVIFLKQTQLFIRFSVKNVLISKSSNFRD